MDNKYKFCCIKKNSAHPRLQFDAKILMATPLPKIIDLRSKCPAIYDQGSLGSCTANAIAAALQYEELQNNKIQVMPSRLFIYFNERLLENTLQFDSGASLTDGVSVIQKFGACNELLWPYCDSCESNGGIRNRDGLFQYQEKPATICYEQAKKYSVPSDKCVSLVAGDLQSMKKVLHDGHLIFFGAYIYASFVTPINGLCKFPDISKEALLGGHALTIVGYDDTQNVMIVRNSWGITWGMGGYCYMPYDYFTKLFLLNGETTPLAFDMHAFYGVTPLYHSPTEPTIIPSAVTTAINEKINTLQKSIDALQITINDLKNYVNKPE